MLKPRLGHWRALPPQYSPQNALWLQVLKRDHSVPTVFVRATKESTAT